jgi:hypothetical protein
MTREWWFSDEVDEVLPQGKPSPEELFHIAPDGAIRCKNNLVYQQGQTVSLAYCDNLGSKLMRFNHNGTFVVPDAPPAANWIVPDNDSERGGDSLSEVARNEAEYLKDGEESEEIVYFYYWSKPILYRIGDIVDGKVTLTCEEPEKLTPPASDQGDDPAQLALEM